MKKFIISVLACITFSTCFAGQFDTGRFELYSHTGGSRGNCDVGRSLVLDKAEQMNNVAFLSNFINGYCQIYIFPDERYYVINDATTDECGSVTYTSSRITEKGLVDLEIKDHRKRTCGDTVEAQVELLEHVPNQRAVKWYSSN